MLSAISEGDEKRPIFDVEDFTSDLNDTENLPDELEPLSDEVD
jgi:hypothetical protein